jgi:large subunit ribosomal protein L6
MIIRPLRPVLSRCFSTSTNLRSHVGSAPLILPPGVELSVTPKQLDEVTLLRMKLDSQRNGKPKINLTQTVQVTGPKGSVQLDVADFIKIVVNGDKAKVSIPEEQARAQRQMWGTTRSLINNGINGVSEGHLSIIKFVGTGYRAILETGDKGQQQLSLRVGYCVPKTVRIPKDLKVTVPLPHRVIIEGIDKQKVKLLAATIRKFRPPEPYKGKGIFVDNETIKLKNRKIK